MLTRSRPSRIRPCSNNNYWLRCCKLGRCSTSEQEVKKRSRRLGLEWPLDKNSEKRSDWIDRWSANFCRPKESKMTTSVQVMTALTKEILRSNACYNSKKTLRRESSWRTELNALRKHSSSWTSYRKRSPFARTSSSKDSRRWFNRNQVFWLRSISWLQGTIMTYGLIYIDR